MNVVSSGDIAMSDSAIENIIYDLNEPGLVCEDGAPTAQTLAEVRKLHTSTETVPAEEGEETKVVTTVDEEQVRQDSEKLKAMCSNPEVVRTPQFELTPTVKDVISRMEFSRVDGLGLKLTELKRKLCEGSLKLRNGAQLHPEYPQFSGSSCNGAKAYAEAGARLVRFGEGGSVVLKNISGFHSWLTDNLIPAKANPTVVSKVN